MKAGQTKARNKNLLREEREARPRFERIPATIYLKKLPSTLVTFGGTIKSEMMSASPAIAIWKIANARTSLNINSCLHVIKAMAEKLKAKKKGAYRIC